MSRGIRRYFYEVLTQGTEGELKGAVFNYVMIALITANIIAVIAGTVPNLPGNISYALDFVSHFALIVYTVEYLLRVWVCVEDTRYRGGPVTARLRYLVTPLAFIDLLVIVPFIAPPLIIRDLKEANLYRLFQLFVILKMIRYSNAVQTMAHVVNKKRSQLVMVLYLILFILVTVSTLMFFVEHQAQPEKFSSIPATMWWGVETLTTVGYGDIVPVTPQGKILGAIVALLGVGFIALPAGILASGFYEEFSRERKETVTCPYCGREFRCEHSNCPVRKQHE